MNKSDVAWFIHFNFWADKRILAACERVRPTEFTLLHAPDPGWGSLRSILVHTLDAEYGWRCVMQALDEDQILEADDFADVAALKARWDSGPRHLVPVLGRFERQESQIRTMAMIPTTGQKLGRRSCTSWPMASSIAVKLRLS